MLLPGILLREERLHQRSFANGELQAAVELAAAERETAREEGTARVDVATAEVGESDTVAVSQKRTQVAASDVVWEIYGADWNTRRFQAIMRSKCCGEDRCPDRDLDQRSR